MRVLLQRVSGAAVEVDRNIVGRIGKGLLLLVGIEDRDTAADVEWMVGKIIRLRIFADAEGKMNLSVGDVQGEILAVSQFTLFASYKKGNRPSFSRAAGPAQARELFDRFVIELESVLGRSIPTGVFGADMRVDLVNDGPVTFMLDSRQAE